jgi:hypothetical protein
MRSPNLRAKIASIRVDQFEACRNKPHGWFSQFIRAKLDEEFGIQSCRTPVVAQDTSSSTSC